MIVVLDSSAGVGMALGRDEAAELLDRVTEADWVIAPSLYICEVTNAFWKYYRFGDMPIERCRRGLQRAIGLPDDLIGAQQLHEEGFALACRTGMPVYDMLFLVLARRHDAVLLTLDAELKARARKESVRTFGGEKS